jgi:undecaprenyl-diphosphatase
MRKRLQISTTTLGRRFRRMIAAGQTRLSAHSYFGLQIAAGVLVMVGASWIFGGISEDVWTGDPLTFVDERVAEWFHARTTPFMTASMLVVSNLHGVVAISLYVALLALYVLWKRDWYWLWVLGLAVPGGMLLNELMKFAFQRARPSFDTPLLTLSTFSFPSGHVAGSALFYGMLAAMLVSKLKAWRWRVRVAYGALAMVVIVALSRLYLGVHYLSDVLAAFAEAAAWLSLCLMATKTYSRHLASNLRKVNQHVSI